MGFFRASAWLGYQGLQGLLLLAGAPFYALRRGGVGHYLPTLRGRATLGLGRAPSDGPRRLWIHAVSVGEAGVAATLARRLPSDLPLVVTTVTPTGQAHAERLFRGKAFAGRDVEIAYLPFDFGWTVGRFVARFRPRALVLTEGDYWPLTLSRLRRAGVPVAVANGRLSDRAFRRQRSLGRINDLFYAPVRRFGVQTEEDLRRLTELGVDAARIRVTGNLKFDSDPPAPLPELEARLESVAAGRSILVAGSTMEGEDEQVLDAFEGLGAGERALLILVPRHPERWDRVERLLHERGVAAVRRTALDDLEDRVDVVLLDSLGELASLYRLAAAAFIGGTLVPTGGHNPLEPALFGTPTVVGPSMHNFQEMADRFDREDAWGRADDGAGLGRLWRAWLDDPTAALRVGERALALLESNRGAVDRTLEMLLPLLHEPDRAEDRP